MVQDLTAYRRQPCRVRLLVRGWGLLALAPLVLMLPEIFTGSFAGLAISVADVLGTGTFLVFLCMLSVTPLVTITGAAWLRPLRWWFGMVMFATALTDLVIASIVTGNDFEGGFAGRIAGHTFLVVGLVMVLLTVPVAVTASRAAQRRLGKYWKRVQQLVYVVWLLVLAHLALLFGLGTSDLVHQRFYQSLAVSVPLLALRLPPVRRWVVRTRKAGHPWQVTLVVLPLALLFATGFAALVNEEVFKGVQAFLLRPVANLRWLRDGMLARVRTVRVMPALSAGSAGS